MKTYGTVTCNDCTQILEGKTQVYTKEGETLCEECNWRKSDELPRRKSKIDV